eukprot:TRINITY_DN8289_c0_g2_i1.p1 TRINITY_DN8289_c0_g2~~TRINITY_DN8289_c0_g2_i1.p1  ORF type:complete len:569 (+),score=118.69 TRINITY_DN8289_c0_g2_i1:85-1791(+)
MGFRSLIYFLVILSVGIEAKAFLQKVKSKYGEILPNSTIVQIRMRDGVDLYTVIYMWAEWPHSDPRSAVLLRSPYPEIEQDIAQSYLPEGFVIVEQRMRGMGESDGTFSFWNTAANDGYDTMQWIKNQSWSNGIVFAFGASADGANALGEILNSPPQLKAQYIIWSALDQGHSIGYQGGAFREELAVGWLDLIMRPKFVNELYEHEAFSSWWENMTLAGHYGNIDFPSVHNAGWFDIFQQIQLDTFAGLQYQSHPSVHNQSYIVISPHGHCFFATDVTPFPDSNVNAAWEISREIFMEIANPANASRTVRDMVGLYNLYVMAPRSENPNNVGNYWSSLNSWPLITPVNYYLQPDRSLARSPPAAAAPSYSAFSYNPKDPVVTWGGNNLFATCGPRNQLEVDFRDSVISFTSEPLAADTAITGEVTATLFVSSDVEDTDFTAKLEDLYPSLKVSDLVQDGIIRMKWRDNLTVPVPMTNGTVYKATLSLWSTSWVFPVGHRIRVSISSSNWPRFNAHINRFLPIALWNTTTPVIAHNQVYHDSTHASYVTLPMVSLANMPLNKNFTKFVV